MNRTRIFIVCLLVSGLVLSPALWAKGGHGKGGGGGKGKGADKSMKHQNKGARSDKAMKGQGRKDCEDGTKGPWANGKKGEKRPHPMNANEKAASLKRICEVAAMHQQNKGTCLCDICQMARKIESTPAGQFNDLVIPSEMSNPMPVPGIGLPDADYPVSSPGSGKGKGKSKGYGKGKGRCNQKGNNGLGNGVDPQPPGNPPVNDASGTPGQPGNRGHGKGKGRK